MTYQRRGVMQIVIGSLLVFPGLLYSVARDGVLAITPVSIVGGVVLVLGLVKRGRGPLYESGEPASPLRPDVTDSATVTPLPVPPKP
jgi:hypothetical protein